MIAGQARAVLDAAGAFPLVEVVATALDEETGFEVEIAAAGEEVVGLGEEEGEGEEDEGKGLEVVGLPEDEGVDVVGLTV